MAKYKLPTAKELLDAGVHFGHQIRRWHPNMEKHIYTVKKNTHIIDLEDTEKMLKEACDVLHEVASKGGQIIFVGTKKQVKFMVETEAKNCGALFVSERWLGGTITNFGVIGKKTKRLVKMLKEREEGVYKKYTKKERLLLDREIEKLQRSVGGIVGLNSIPSAIFVIDAKREHTAIKEAKVAGVKVVALVDTNTNPEGIDYVIPGNDDGIKSVALILKTVSGAIEAGYKEFAKKGETDTKKQEKPSKDLDDTEETINVTGTESPVGSKNAGKAAVKKEITGDDEDLPLIVEESKDEDKPKKDKKSKKTKDTLESKKK